MYNGPIMAGMWDNIFGGGADKLFEKADSLAREECWPEAISTIERAIQKMPDQDRAALADAERKLAEYTRAYKKHLAGAITLLADDGDREAAAELLDIALSFADDEDERKRFAALLALPPAVDAPPKEVELIDKRSSDVIGGLADSYSEVLEPGEKEAVFARPELFLRGFVLWNEGRFDESATLLRSFLEESPHDPYGLLFLGLSHSGRGDREEGARLLQEAIRYEPSLVLASLSLGLILKDLGRAEKSASVLEKLCAIVTEFPDQFSPRRREEVIFHTVSTLIESGDAARAEEIYVKVREEELFDEHLLLRARLAEAKGDLDDAARMWDEFLKPGMGGGGSIMGHSASSRGPAPADFEKGADFFSKQGDSTRAGKYYQRAALNLTQGAHAGGEGIPLGDLLRMRKKLALSLVSLGKRDEALRIADEMDQLEPPPPEAAEIREACGPE